VARLLQRHELVQGLDLEEFGRPTALVGMDPVTQPAISVSVGPAAPVPAHPALYRVLLPDPRCQEPVALPELVRLTTTGVVDAGTLVRRERTSPIPASQLSELERIFATPALQWREDEIRNPRLRGELRAAVLLPLIHSLYANRETGMLHLSDGERRKKIYFVEGRPDFVASTERKEMLGHYLLDHQHCLEMEMDMALAMLPQHNGRLGDALVKLGVLRPVQLYRAVSSQVRGRYLESFRWRSGQWLYVRSAESREETYPIEQDAQVLMRDAALELHPSELEAALSPMWEKVLRPAAQAPAPLGAFQVPDAWRWVIQQANGEATVGALFGRCARQSGLDEEDAMRAIFLGISCQLLEAG
jgi:serine/threonine-protein kinase